MTRLLPSSVVVGGIRYSVRRIKNLSAGEQKLDGHINYGRAIIEIEDDIDDQVAIETLWHEIIHAILVQAGQSKISKNEMAIEALAYGIAQVITDNPRLQEDVT